MEMISIDEDGDLHLVVGARDECAVPPTKLDADPELAPESKHDGLLVSGNDPEATTQIDEPENYQKVTTYIVCSKTLSRSSPFFKRLLYGGFAESKKPDKGHWTVSLPADNPEAMKIILDIMHSRFREIPVNLEMGTDMLYHLTVLTNKYDLTHLLRPWARGSVKRWKPRHSHNDAATAWGDGYIHQFTYKTTMSQQLWISWELGDEDMFRALCAYSSAYSPSEESALLAPGITLFMNGEMEPPGTIDLIYQHRFELISELLKPFRDAFQQPFSCRGPFRCCFRENQDWDQKEIDSCEAILAGTVLHGLDRKQLWPIPDSSAWHESPALLRNILEGAVNLGTTRLDKQHRKCIRRCGGRLVVGKNSEIRKPVLTEFQKRYLTAQAEKSGLENSEPAVW